jgi:hypothetical protein
MKRFLPLPGWASSLANSPALVHPYSADESCKRLDQFRCRHQAICFLTSDGAVPP